MKALPLLIIIFALALIIRTESQREGDIEIPQGRLLRHGGHIEFRNDFSSSNLSINKNGNPFLPVFFVEALPYPEGIKWGFIDSSTSTGETNLYNIHLQASRAGDPLGFENFILRKNETSSDCYNNPRNTRFCNSTDPRFEFEDICLNSSQCFVQLSNNNKTIDWYFNLTHNDSLGYTIGDPTVTFTGNDVESIDMDVIDEDQYIILWCDETEDDTTWAVYFTNGTIITSATDIDSINGGCTTGSDYLVDILILDKENNKAAAVWQGSAGVPKTATFNFISPAAPILEIVAPGRTTAVSLVKFNNTRYGVSWIDSSQRDASSILMDEVGNNLTAVFDIDTEVGSPANAIDSTTFTNDPQNFSVIWFDSNASNIKFITLEANITGTKESLTSVITSVVVDTGVSAGNGAVGIDSFNETALVVGWMATNGIASSINFATYYFNATLITAKTIIDGNPGLSTSVSIGTINSTAFAEVWHDVADGDTDFEIWDIDGNQLVDEVTVQSLINDGATAVISAKTENSICQDYLVAASTSGALGTGGITKTFRNNGSLWVDGFCPCNYDPPTVNYEPPCDCNIVQNITIIEGGNFTLIGVPGGNETYTLEPEVNITGWGVHAVTECTMINMGNLNVQS